MVYSLQAITKLHKKSRREYKILENRLVAAVKIGASNLAGLNKEIESPYAALESNLKLLAQVTEAKSHQAIENFTSYVNDALKTWAQVAASTAKKLQEVLGKYTNLKTFKKSKDILMHLECANMFLYELHEDTKPKKAVISLIIRLYAIKSELIYTYTQLKNEFEAIPRLKQAILKANQLIQEYRNRIDKKYEAINNTDVGKQIIIYNTNIKELLVKINALEAKVKASEIQKEIDQLYQNLEFYRAHLLNLINKKDHTSSLSHAKIEIEIYEKRDQIRDAEKKIEKYIAVNNMNLNATFIEIKDLREQLQKISKECLELQNSNQEYIAQVKEIQELNSQIDSLIKTRAADVKNRSRLMNYLYQFKKSIANIDAHIESLKKCYAEREAAKRRLKTDYLSRIKDELENNKVTNALYKQIEKSCEYVLDNHRYFESKDANEYMQQARNLFSNFSLQAHSASHYLKKPVIFTYVDYLGCSGFEEIADVLEEKPVDQVFVYIKEDRSDIQAVQYHYSSRYSHSHTSNLTKTPSQSINSKFSIFCREQSEDKSIKYDLKDDNVLSKSNLGNLGTGGI